MLLTFLDVMLLPAVACGFLAPDSPTLGQKCILQPRCSRSFSTQLAGPLDRGWRRGSLCHASHRQRSQPRMDALSNNAILGPLVSAAAKAAVESTGKGGESSGSGRVEWGTWCDTDLFNEVRDLVNRVTFDAQQVWPDLWAVAGGEAASATLRIASGPQHDVILRLFASPAGIPAEDRSCEARYADGVLTLLRPIVGAVRIEKLRPSGDILGVPKELKAGLPTFEAGLPTASRAFLQLGGPQQRYLATTSTAAMLEVVLRHETHGQASALPAELPNLAEVSWRHSVDIAKRAPLG